MNYFEGKVAVVLGASAEAGTGWAIAEALAAAGAKVVVGARSEAPLRKLAQKIGGTAVVCDAGNEAQVNNLAEAAIKQYGKLDIAINSAGATTLGMVADANDEELDEAFRLNFYGNVYFIKHMAVTMEKNGSIVVISSLSTTHPIVPNFAYACAKSATDCLVRYAALEYGPRNIRVNSILPGPIVSDMAKDMFSNPAAVKVFESEIPLGRLGYPRDYADAALWLAGPAFVTGLNIPVCGGNQLTRFPFISELPGADRAWEGGVGTALYDREHQNS